MGMNGWARSILPYGLVALACGCSLLSDLDRFETEDAGAGTGAADAGGGTDADLGCSNDRTLCVRLTKFGPHMATLVVADLVSEDGDLRARAILDPLSQGAPEAEIVLPLAIAQSEVPAGGRTHPLHLALWADASSDRRYTPNEGNEGKTVDHDWEIPLPADAKVEFEHDTVFKDLLPRPQPIGGDFELKLTGMEVHAGKLLEVMVIEADSERTVGLYRLQSIPDSGQVTLTIPEIIDTSGGGGVAYRVEYYADANGNGRYDALPDDHSWATTLESDGSGAKLDRPHSGPGIEFEELTYQFPFEN